MEAIAKPLLTPRGTSNEVKRAGTIGTHLPLRPLIPFVLKCRDRPPNLTELPVEIICEIFEKFIEADYGDPPRPVISHSCRSDPTILGQICSRWRAAAVNLPKLWSNINIHNPQTSQAHLVNTWLERSKNTPLYLKIAYNRNDDIDRLGAGSQILTSFISHLEYWREIDFHLPIELLDAFCSMIQIPTLPLLLESSAIGFSKSPKSSKSRYPHTPDYRPFIRAIWKFLYLSPNLRRVDWTDARMSTFPKHAPYQQLTHIRTMFKFSLSTYDVLIFLAAVPRIEEVSIEIIKCISKKKIDIGTPPIFLPHLRFLSVHSSTIQTHSLFSNLTCPSLQDLKIYHRSLLIKPNLYLSELIRLLRRSGCQLQTLNINDRYLDDDELGLHIPSTTLHSLTSLTISKDIISDQIIRLLMKKFENGQHQFLPRLMKLHLDMCETTDGLLTTMISSRWHDAETSRGALRWVLVVPKTTFGSIDDYFFNTRILH